MSRRKRSEVSLGHDAFLDIVANLVGILIILVVVLGSRSQQVAEAARSEAASAAQVDAAALRRERAAAAGATADVHRLEEQIARYDRELADRKRERDALVDAVAAAEEQWSGRQAEMAEDERRQVELEARRRALADRAAELADLEEERAERDDEVVTLEHLPTPMARTVFGEEVHFRLKDKRLAVVPIDQLVEAVETDFKRTLRGSMRTGEHGATVGPVRDFLARYRMQTQREAVSRGGQVGTAVTVQLAKLELEPVREPLGESIDEALQPESQLAFELAGRDPRVTTVTVWVYPDSFAEFRTLKEQLYRRGYATAARPLPEGTPISGSPSGTRSSAQ